MRFGVVERDPPPGETPTTLELRAGPPTRREEVSRPGLDSGSGSTFSTLALLRR